MSGLSAATENGFLTLSRGTILQRPVRKRSLGTNHYRSRSFILMPSRPKSLVVRLRGAEPVAKSVKVSESSNERKGETMLVSIKRWTTERVHDIGQYKTTVTVATKDVTVAVTLNGHLSRKVAISQTFNHLQRENRWSSDFLNRLSHS